MFEAELHGKRISYDSEDLLTSRVFGLIRHIPPQVLLLPVLSKAKSFRSHNNFPVMELMECKNPKYIFWPRSNMPNVGEPDLCIVFHGASRNYILAIEVKFLSSKSGTGEDNDQLNRYYKGLISDDSRKYFQNEEISGFKGEFLGIVYLTVDSSTKELEESYQIIQKQTKDPVLIYGITWRDFFDTINTAIQTISDEWYRPFIKDLINLLDHLRLRHFAGFSSVLDMILPCFSYPLFYEPDVQIVNELYNWDALGDFQLSHKEGVLFYEK